MDEKLVRDALRMFSERALYWSNKENAEPTYSEARYCGGVASAYQSAYDMLQYAIDGKGDCLAQFDYYGEDE